MKCRASSIAPREGCFEFNLFLQIYGYCLSTCLSYSTSEVRAANFAGHAVQMFKELKTVMQIFMA